MRIKEWKRKANNREQRLPVVKETKIIKRAVESIKKIKLLSKFEINCINLLLVQYCVVLCCAVLGCIVLYCVTCSVLYCAMLYCVVLLVQYCVALCCYLFSIVLCSVALCCMEQHQSCQNLTGKGH
jgi:hypothetical protein